MKRHLISWYIFCRKYFVVLILAVVYFNHCITQVRVRVLAFFFFCVIIIINFGGAGKTKVEVVIGFSLRNNSFFSRLFFPVSGKSNNGACNNRNHQWKFELSCFVCYFCRCIYSNSSLIFPASQATLIYEECMLKVLAIFFPGALVTLLLNVLAMLLWWNWWIWKIIE